MATVLLPETQAAPPRLDVAPRDLAPRKASPPRIDSVDLLRGLVMVVMVLDHTRDYFTNAMLSPMDLETTTPGLFMTRWITHFCAPVFVFLAGTGVFLAATRGKTRPQLARFLLTRGLWLIFLDVTVVRLAITFNLDYQYIPLGVLWAIGASMLGLAVLIFLPISMVAAVGLTLIAGHNLLDGIESSQFGRFAWVWRVLHDRGHIGLDGFDIFVIYPLIPWVGVMATGFAFGQVVQLRPQRRRRRLILLGLSLIGAFVALRAINVYGDPEPWSYQSTSLFTVLSFLDTNKYPPSLLYLLMTLGPAILALGLLDRGLGALGRPLLTLGRAPLFFYLLQWAMAHALALAVAILQGRPYHWLLASEPFHTPPHWGYSLPVVYLMWGVALLLLYPPSRWFADLKRRRKDPWMSYL
jgi:uncharacterized membrane protein